MTKEKRSSKRVRYEYPVTLTVGRKEVFGIIKNISLGGIYVILKPGDDFVKGLKVGFSVSLSPRAKTLRIEGEGRIVRCALSGSVAIAFISMGDGDFTQLKRLIELNTGSADMGRVMRKFIKGRRRSHKKG